MALVNYRPEDVEPTIHQDSVLILVVDEDGPHRPSMRITEGVKPMRFGVNERAIDGARRTPAVTPMLRRVG